MKNNTDATQGNKCRLRRCFIAAAAMIGALGPLLFQAGMGNLMPGNAIADSNTPRSDAAVIFTGDTARLEAGLSLLREGQTERLLISGVHSPEVWPDVRRHLRISNEDIGNDRIWLDFDAANTIENGVNAAAWVMANNYRDITLVTSEFHAARSYFELRRHLPSDVNIAVVTVPDPAGTPSEDNRAEDLKLLCRIYEVTLGIDNSRGQVESPLCLGAHRLIFE